MSLDLIIELVSGILITGIALLDSLPDYVRAMLAAGVLIGFLRFFESRIPIEDVQLSEAFCKTSLIAMIAIPVMVWLLPSYRMVVFVDELPDARAQAHLGWSLLPAIWFAGFALSLSSFIITRRRMHTAIEALKQPEGERLPMRLTHWMRRLGMQEPISLVLLKGAQPRNLSRRHRIGFPAAAVHWPPSAQDLLIIQSLCRIKLHHNRWFLLTAFMNCCYWPITWVPVLQQRMLNTFQLTMEGLAASCFLDPMGFRNAAHQLDQRLPAPARADDTGRAADRAEGSHSWRHRVWFHTRSYILELRHLLKPAGEIAWKGSVGGKDLGELRWAEPYDKVFLRVGQAVFFAVLLTGVTLKETPPVVEFEAPRWLEVNWMDQFFRRSSEDEDRRDPAAPLMK